jgi:uncharacterized protein YqfB (UPF0267 family)
MIITACGPAENGPILGKLPFSTSIRESPLADVVCITVVAVSVRFLAVVTLTMVWSKETPGFDCAIAVVAISRAGMAQLVSFHTRLEEITAPPLP